MDNLLEVRDVHTFIGQFHILQGVTVQRAQRRDHHTAGAQRRGQDDDPQDDPGADAAAPGSGHPRRRRRFRGRRTFDISALGIGFVPDYRAIFRDLTVA